MMIKPGITELSRYVDSRYTLVTMVAKRARMISDEQNRAEVYDAKAEKSVASTAPSSAAPKKRGRPRKQPV